MIKKFLCLLSIFFFVSPVFADVVGGIKEIDKLDFIEILTGDLALMKDTDYVFYDYVGNFVMLIINFFNYSRRFIAICCFLFIIFSSIKLFFGATELKKFVTDGIFKALFVCIAMGIYPSVVAISLKLGTNFGTQLSGGYSAIQNKFISLVSFSLDVWKDTMEDYLTGLRDKGLVDENGNYMITLESFNKQLGKIMGQEDALQYAKSLGIEIYDKDDVNGLKYEAESNQWGGERYKKLWERINNLEDLKNESNLADKNTRKMMKEQYAILDTLVEFFSGSDTIRVVEYTQKGREEKIVENYNEASIAEVLTAGEQQIKDLANNLFVKGTKFLSVSSTIKISTLLGRMIAAKANISFDLETENYYTGKKESDPDSLKDILSYLGNAASGFFYKCGTCFFIILIFIEYYLAILEFLLVMAFSTFLIPLYFIDATKQYAANIIKTVLTFFLKIMITSTICFFVITNYLSVLELLLTKSPETSTTFWLYVFSLLLGYLIVKKAGGLVGAVLSGNPSIGLDDVSRIGHSAMHAGRVAGNLVKTGLHAGEKLIQGGTRAVMGGISTANAANTAMQQTYRSLKATSDLEQSVGGKGMSVWEMGAHSLGAGVQTMGSSIGQSVSDGLYKGLTGQEKRREQNAGDTGTLGFGQSFFDKQGHQQKANFSDMKDAAKTKGTDVANQKVQNIMNNRKKHLPSSH